MTETRATDQKRQHIVVVGSGLPAWMAAGALAETVNMNDHSISVVNTANVDDGMPPFDHGDATFPAHDKVPGAVGDESSIIHQTGGSFTHGIAVSGWAKPGTTYFHPFGSIGAALGPVSFHQLTLRLRREGIAVRLANYSLAALAAQAGRFVPRVSDPGSVLATCEHGLHLESPRLADSLRRRAKSVGVRQVTGKHAHTEHRNNGDVRAIVTTEGKRVTGDLFIDCSGPDALLANRTVQTGWHDWSAWLPCDSLVSAIIPTTLPPAPYSHAEAYEAGWIQHLPMQGRTVMNGLYRAGSGSESQLLSQLLASSGSDQVQPVFAGPVRFGRRADTWSGNCIALGTAAALIDPVAISNLQLLQTGVRHLLPLLPSGTDYVAARKEYNRQMALQFDRGRDFAIMHYKLNGRDGDPFWDECRAMTLPQELAYKLELYQSRGQVPLYDEEPLEETAWLNLFDEHGINPRGYSTIVNGFSLEDLQQHLHRVRAVMMEALPKMPLHADYLAYLESTHGKPGTGKSR